MSFIFWCFYVCVCFVQIMLLCDFTLFQVGKWNETQGVYRLFRQFQPHTFLNPSFANSVIRIGLCSVICSLSNLAPSGSWNVIELGIGIVEWDGEKDSEGEREGQGELGKEEEVIIDATVLFRRRGMSSKFVLLHANTLPLSHSFNRSSSLYLSLPLCVCLHSMGVCFAAFCRGSA